ncbi:hypothetical protein H0H93_012425 [Arthromyces matolae]|nr:hypothetical protein H0H93_012425 [Arthromyces matolae]
MSHRLTKLFNHFNPRPKATVTEQDGPIVENARLPTYDELPKFKDFAGCAWAVWGDDDELGTVNLLTPDVVQRAAKEEIMYVRIGQWWKVAVDVIYFRTGHAISLNWPLNFPEKPLFKRKAPQVKTIARDETHVRRDDEIHINTQSGTQWDGMRHFGLIEHGVYYNNTQSLSLPVGVAPIPNPKVIEPSEAKLGIQNWANHGICGRGVLLDLVRHQTKSGTVPLPYDPWTTHAITVSELEECAASQGVRFRTGDILILRVGFIEKYYNSTQEERDALAGRAETL